MHRMVMTVVLVSHNMEDVARLCQRLLVLANGELVADGVPREIFSRSEFVREIGLRPPEVVSLMESLRMRGWNVRADVVNVQEAYAEIMKELGRGRDRL